MHPLTQAPFSLSSEFLTPWQTQLDEYLASCPLSAEQAEHAFNTLSAFYTKLLETNAHTNLTRIVSAEDFLNRHILDSVMLSPYVNKGNSIIDIGTGAGFPAIPLNIFRPDLWVTAVDSVGKKTQFIASVQEALSLTQFKVFNNRAEVLGQDNQHRQQYDTATARAVADLPILLELLSPLVKTGGQLLIVKGEKAYEEVTRSKNALNMLGLTDPEIKEERGSVILKLSKIRPTLPEYPRATAKFKKSPL